MKNRTFLLIFIATFFACKQTEKPISKVDATRESLENKRSELKNKQELAKMESEMAELDTEINKMNGFKERKATVGQILGEAVIIRQSASAQSKKLGNFDQGESVKILQKQVSLTNNEAILTQDVAANDDLIIKKGSAVQIRRYIAEQDYFEIDFKDTYLNLPAYVVQQTVNENWYQIRRANGMSGWVFGKFLKEI
jgi:hypothetical protein